jgi:hypothetical protein
MAKTKERQASALTLAAQERDAERPILRAFGRNTPANAPASLVPALAPPLAPGLAGGPKAAVSRKPAPPRFPAVAAHWGRKRFRRQRGPILREPVAILAAAGAGLTLGEPLSIRAVARLIGYSPWTVRQTLIPRGLPYFRSGASGRLIFYRDQVIRWIETQQQAYYPGVKP